MRISLSADRFGPAVTIYFLLYAATVAWTGVAFAQADSPEELARSAVHALDYIAVDYADAVSDGVIISVDEYGEMQEFAAAVSEALNRLPARQNTSNLRDAASRLTGAIEDKLTQAEVGALCAELIRGLIGDYQIATAPKSLPDESRTGTLYAEQCASCHGANGHGDGPAGVNLEPAPSNFRDRERQSHRSVLGLYNTISLGVEGTGMASYANLPESDRWALALHVSRWFATEEELLQGEALWSAGTGRELFGDLGAMMQSSPKAMSSADEIALLTWLRAQPALLVADKPLPLVFAQNQVRAALGDYRDGNQSKAYQRTLQAYLEGFELVEPALSTLNADLLKETETAMASLRNSVNANAPLAQVEADGERALALLAQSQNALDDTHFSPGMAFFSAFIILIREGLEAILVIAAISAFLRKSNRPDAMRWVNAGWIIALITGALTWVATKYFINFSGASRELTEGITALLAAGMLLYVGCWLHNHAHARQWQSFIRSKVAATLTQGTLWSLALVSFFAVFREIVETILFYETLWVQADAGAQPAIGGGFVVAVICLLILAWAIFRFSEKVPLKLFFKINTALLFILAVVFAGKGIAALQEAGVISVMPIQGPSFGLLGIYPTAQGLGLQILLVLMMLGFLAWQGQKDRSADA